MIYHWRIIVTTLYQSGALHEGPEFPCWRQKDSCLQNQLIGWSYALRSLSMKLYRSSMFHLAKLGPSASWVLHHSSMFHYHRCGQFAQSAKSCGLTPCTSSIEVFALIFCIIVLCSCIGWMFQVSFSVHAGHGSIAMPVLHHPPFHKLSGCLLWSKSQDFGLSANWLFCP